MGASGGQLGVPADAPALRDEEFFEDIDRILLMAKEEGATLRLLGAAAVRLRSPTARSMAKSRPLSDLDFVAYKGEAKKLDALFARLGYRPSQTFNMLHGSERLLYFGHDGQLRIDIWLERFSMAHTFDFKDRLELDSPTLPLSDLLMTKLQIVQLNEKDIRDMISLLADHDLSDSDSDRERINVTRLANQCARDWGIHKTFTLNLSKIKELVPNYISDRDVAHRTGEKVDKILDSIESAPKTFGWKMRAKIGERKPWYETPEFR